MEEGSLCNISLFLLYYKFYDSLINFVDGGGIDHFGDITIILREGVPTLIKFRILEVQFFKVVGINPVDSEVCFVIIVLMDDVVVLIHDLGGRVISTLYRDAVVGVGDAQVLKI